MPQDPENFALGIPAVSFDSDEDDSGGVDETTPIEDPSAGDEPQDDEGGNPEQSEDDLESDVTDQGDDETPNEPADSSDDAKAKSALEAMYRPSTPEVVDAKPSKPHPKPTPSPAPEASESLDELFVGQVDDLINQFGLSQDEANKFVARQRKQIEAVVGRVDAKVKAALEPYQGMMDQAKERAAREYTAAVDSEIDNWTKETRIQGFGSSSKTKPVERLYRAYLVREAERIVQTYPSKDRANLTSNVIFAAALPAAQAAMRAAGIKIPASVPVSPQSRASGSSNRPRGHLPAASAASAARPSGRTSGVPSRASTYAKMDAAASKS